MITHLLIIMCLSANDCQVHRHATFEGPNAALSCELAKEQLLARHERLTITRLQCEVE